MKEVHHIVATAALLLAAGTTLRAQSVPASAGPAASAMPAVLQNVGFEPPLNGQMPLDLPFRHQTRRRAQPRDYFQQPKPVLLAFVYYCCLMLSARVVRVC